jgi:4-amino-4-deoxy-L-arabinose transferase-like glycosyltransferase
VLVAVEGLCLSAAFRSASIAAGGVDETDYDRIALNLSQNQCYATQNAPPCLATADRPPGYPFFLLLVYELTNNSTFAVKFMQFGMLAATSVLIYFVAKTFVDRRSAFIGACLTATYPPLASMASHRLTESLATLLAACFVWMFIEARRHGKTWQFALLGAILGYASLVRPSFMLLAFLAASLPFLLRDIPLKGRLTRTLVTLILTGCCIVPWTVRNWRIAHAFVVVSSNGGENLLISALQYSGATSYKNANGDWLAIQDHMPRIALSTSPSPREYIDHELAVERQCREDAKQTLQQVSSVVLLKSAILRVIYLWGVGDYSPGRYGDYSELWHRFVQIHYVLLTLAVAAGIWLQRRALLTQWPLWIMAIYFTSIHMLYLAETRFTFPARPFILIYAGIAIHTVLSKGSQVIYRARGGRMVGA